MAAVIIVTGGKSGGEQDYRQDETTPRTYDNPRDLINPDDARDPQMSDFLNREDRTGDESEDRIQQRAFGPPPTARRISRSMGR